MSAFSIQKNIATYRRQRDRRSAKEDGHMYYYNIKTNKNTKQSNAHEMPMYLLIYCTIS